MRRQGIAADASSTAACGAAHLELHHGVPAVDCLLHLVAPALDDLGIGARQVDGPRQHRARHHSALVHHSLGQPVER